jgi:hypothetical protein
MKRTISIAFAMLLVSFTSFMPGSGQDRSALQLLDQNSARRLLPDKVPLEMETIPADAKNLAALQFADGLRIVFAPLVTSGYAADFREKYAYILVGETGIQLDQWTLPAGMVGLGWEGPTDPDAPTRCLVARDFTGAVINRITMRLDLSAAELRVGLKITGANEFELRLGKYVIRGSERKSLLS